MDSDCYFNFDKCDSIFPWKYDSEKTRYELQENKDMKIRLADYVADFLAAHGITQVFSVVGVLW